MKNKSRLVFLIAFTALFIIALLMLTKDISVSRQYPIDFDLFKAEEFDIKDGVLTLHSEADGGELHTSPRFCLRDGSHFLNITYSSDADYKITAYMDNDQIVDVMLPAGEGQIQTPFILEWPTDRAYLSFEPAAEGSVRISDIRVTSDRMLYTDSVFRIAALILLYLLALILIIKPGVLGIYKTDGSLNRERLFILTGLALIILIVNLPFYINIDIDDAAKTAFGPFESVARFGVDTRAQLMRLEGVMYGLLDRQFPVIIAPNYLNECGELTFLYPNIFLYPFALMRIFGASIPFTFRWFNVGVNTAVVLSMYYSCRQVSDKKKLCLLITALYVFDPHRLRVMLTKGASMGMGLPYIFIPLAIVGAYLIVKKNKKGLWLLAFGMSGVLESHITTVLLLAGLLIFAFVSCIKELIADRLAGIKLTALAALLGLMINLGFFVIFVYYYFSGLNTGSLLWTEYTKYTLSPAELFTNEESLFFSVCLIAAIAVLVFAAKKGAEFRFAFSMILYSFILWLMTSDLIPHDDISGVFGIYDSFLGYMQKPHRFYTVMAGALLIGILILAKELSAKKLLPFLALICLASLFGTCIKYGDQLSSGWLFTDALSGDINALQNWDYLPEGADADMDFSGTASLSDESKVTSIYYKKLGTTVDYHYRTDAPDIYAEFPLLLYKGYVAFDETGAMLDIISGREAKITIRLNGDGGEHALHVGFAVRPLFKILYAFSVLFCIIAVCFYVIRQRGGKEKDI